MNAAAEKHTNGEDGRKTILLYSPDLNFCFSLSMLFQDQYNVLTTTNLGSLDGMVAERGPDLVMIDAVPSSKLIARLEGLQSTRKKLPVIVLYVYNSRDVNLDREIRSHVDSVFYKPFDIGTVSQRIGELLSS
jgi:DNA-binding NtrC family response regulator